MINVVITSGGTSERIDNVRKITNSSSGKLGSVISDKLNELLNDEHKIFYVCSKKAIKPSDLNNVEIIEIEDTSDLVRETTRLLNEYKIDYFIHSMAVSDYTVEYVTNEIKYKKYLENADYNSLFIDRESKISSYEDNLFIKLKRTPKVISLIKEISPSTHLIGFKLLDKVSEEELIDVAYNLKVKNKCDLVLANDLDSIRNGSHIGYLIRDKNNYLKVNGKEDIAINLVKEMLKND